MKVVLWPEFWHDIRVPPCVDFCGVRDMNFSVCYMGRSHHLFTTYFKNALEIHNILRHNLTWKMQPMAPILYINILRIFVAQLWCCTVIMTKRYNRSQFIHMCVSTGANKPSCYMQSIHIVVYRLWIFCDSKSGTKVREI